VAGTTAAHAAGWPQQQLAGDELESVLRVGAHGDAAFGYLGLDGFWLRYQSRNAGRFGPRELVADERVEVEDPALAIGPHGEVLVAWDNGQESGTRGHARIRLRGGRWGPSEPLALPGGTAGVPVVAIGPQGKRAVAFQDANRFVEAITADGRGWLGAPQPASSYEEASDVRVSGTDVGAAVDRWGTTTVLWRGTSGALRGARARPGQAFGSPYTIAATDPEGARDPRFVASMDPEGRVFCIWDPGDGRIRAGVAPPGGPVQPAFELPDGVSRLALAAGGAGRALAAWIAPAAGSGADVWVALAAAGRWQPPRMLRHLGDGSSADDLLVAMSARGNMVVGWDRDYRTSLAARRWAGTGPWRTFTRSGVLLNLAAGDRAAFAVLYDDPRTWGVSHAFG
jgi:hypothetical protein